MPESGESLQALLLFVVGLPPLVMLVYQLRVRRRVVEEVERKRRRFHTFVKVELVIRQIRTEFPIGQALLLSAEGISQSQARRIYEAKPASGLDWDEKVALSRLLGVLDRLSAGVQLEVLDAEVFQRLAGRNLRTIWARVRTFVTLSTDDRPGRYAALSHVDVLFGKLEAHRAAHAHEQRAV